jgi:SNF2 family DNA or RNA helicase
MSTYTIHSHGSQIAQIVNLQGSKAKKQKQEEEAAAALEAHIATAQEKGGNSPEKVGETKEEATRREQRKLMPDIKGEMRDYQIKGVKWLSSLWSVSSWRFFDCGFDLDFDTFRAITIA